MMIQITSDRLVKDIQEEFNALFPFIKIDFYKTAAIINQHKQKSNKLLSYHTMGGENGLYRSVTFVITPLMTVEELEALCQEQLGLFVQLSRKFGKSWMEISMTNNWTIREQNERGREICALISKETQV